MLAFGHLEIKEEKKIEEIRRILPNLGEFDQIPQIYHEKSNFLSADRQTDGNISALRAGVPRSYGPPEYTLRFRGSSPYTLRASNSTLRGSIFE